MKVAVIFMVTMVMLMNQEADSWDFWRRTAKAFPVTRKIMLGGKVLHAAALDIGNYFRRWGKREVRDAQFDAAFNAAAQDGVLSDDEIQTVLGVSAKDLPEFKDNFDMDGDGKITVAEFILVTTVTEEREQDNGQK